MYCEICGTQKENGVCPKCGKKEDSNWVIWTILKCMFIPFGVAVVIFFIATFVAVLLKMLEVSLPAIVERGIIPIVQIGIPMLILMFGWIVILIIDLTKHKKK